MTEAKCAKDGGKGQQRVCYDCEVEGCKRAAKYAKGTLCQVCNVKEDPEARRCPECKTQPKSMSRADEWCGNCVRNQAVEAKREAKRPLLAQLCAD